MSVFCRTTVTLLTFLLAGCTTGTDRPSEEPPTDTTTPRDTTAATPAPDSLSEAEAREVLRAVYRPIHTFYRRMETSGTGDTRPPTGMRTPETLVDTLTQTMTPDLARSFAKQLLMQRGDGYIVRPTEKTLLPYPGDGPALETVTARQEGNAYVLTERYARTALHGRVERQNVVRWQEGHWRLVDLQRSTN